MQRAICYVSRCPWPGTMWDTFPKQSEPGNWNEVVEAAWIFGLTVSIRQRSPMVNNGKERTVEDPAEGALVVVRAGTGKQKRVREYWLTVTRHSTSTNPNRSDLIGFEFLQAVIYKAELRGQNMQRSRQCSQSLSYPDIFEAARMELRRQHTDNRESRTRGKP
jgi:hypothetical protein